ncbi:NAD(P)H-binding protein [Wenzhouxiangella limi]|uniref:NAD(P)H-binding protein n=1 Tax=Wenzhouxiangella limi TaxID=2707351 RepID=A0A845V7B8_9GAMM|nr:NAD(P)H-binding protein [Wenzhouxiangella limi]NDY95845.1 NAD(P)H-binding protein [Wenzhouxiangella limi]
MNPARITLLGGTGFIGRALSRRLLAAGSLVRVVSRHAETAADLPIGVSARSADVRDPRAVSAALVDSDAAVYLPGRVQGRRRSDFEEIHARAARTSAACARRAGVARFIYLSALGASPDASAWADQTKAEGELGVAHAFPGAVVVRPSLVFGAHDHFRSDMLGLMRRLPVLPVIGPGTRVQPLHIDDMVEALRLLLRGQKPRDNILQAAGPRVWRHIDLLAALRDRAEIRCRLLALPEWLALMLAVASRILPKSPLSPDQVRLMRSDKIADPENARLGDLGIVPRDPLA